MHSTVRIAAVLALVCATTAETAPTSRAGDCGPAIGWIFGGGGEVPDGGSAWIGPAETAGSTCIDDLAVRLNLFHSLIGDVIVRIGYDRDCDGSVDTQLVDLICRPGTDCAGGGGRGCEANAAGDYAFTGDATETFADPCPVDLVPADVCYGAVSTPGLEIFTGEMLGGCFRLYVEDAVAGETGFLKAFLVSYTEQTCVVPVERASWGAVKAVFGD